MINLNPREMLLFGIIVLILFIIVSFILAYIFGLIPELSEKIING